MARLEKTLMHQISQRLDILQATKEVVWWGRLQSLKVRTRYGHWIQGCPKGTPDMLALIRNKQKGITALFIEVKSDSGKLRPEQLGFIREYESVDGVLLMVCRDIKSLDQYINALAYNFVEDICIAPNATDTLRPQKT